MMYTEEAATKEACLEKIYRNHDKSQVNIMRIHEMTRPVFLGLFKKEVVQITYSFTPSLTPVPSVPPKPASYQNYPARPAPSPRPSAAYTKSFDENRMEILSRVAEKNPDIKEKLFSATAASSPDTRQFGGGGQRQEPSPSAADFSSLPQSAAKSAAGQLDLDLTGSVVPADSPANPGIQKNTASVASAVPADLLAANAPGEMGMLMQAIQKIDCLERKLDTDARFANPNSAEHENIMKITELLERNDFSPSFVSAVVEKIRSNFTLEGLSDFDALQQEVVSWIGGCIKIAAEESVVRPHIITLVGPTGIGKTTTVAKLAAAYMHAYKKAPRPLNVRVITIDNYRIGAKQHLEKFGEIMGVTVSSAETPFDLQTLIAGYKDADIILIDTTGRSPKDSAEIAKMRAFFDGIDCETLLTVSACTKTSDLRDIVRQYDMFACSGMIVTKFDETTRVGNIISVLAVTDLPVRYITTGQRVPKNFEQASVMKFLLALDGFSFDRQKLEEEFPVPANCFEWS